MEAEKDTDWFFDWPTGYVRYRNGKREALQDRDKSPSRLRLTDEEREAIAGAIEAEHGRGAWQWAATLRTLLERTA